MILQTFLWHFVKFTFTDLGPAPASWARNWYWSPSREIHNCDSLSKWKVSSNQVIHEFNKSHLVNWLWICLVNQKLSSFESIKHVCWFEILDSKCSQWIIRSSYQKCSIKMLLLKISQYSQENACVGVSF